MRLAPCPKQKKGEDRKENVHYTNPHRVQISEYGLIEELQNICPVY
jgi:hypothetical protein